MTIMYYYILMIMIDDVVTTGTNLSFFALLSDAITKSVIAANNEKPTFETLFTKP